MEAWRSTSKCSQFTRRGYPRAVLIQHLLQRKRSVQRQGQRQRCGPQRKVTYQSRSSFLKVKNKHQAERTIALKLPFTPRSVQLSKTLSITKLQKHISKASPALNRASLGRLVIAHTKSPNVREGLRYRVHLDYM